MSTCTPPDAGLGRVGLAFAALVFITAVAGSASAQERFQDRYPFREHRYECNPGENCVTRRHQHRWRHNDNDGYYEYRYYDQPRAYYPEPRYYQPGPSFNLTIPLGN